jgi:hypothetical protein
MAMMNNFNYGFIVRQPPISYLTAAMPAPKGTPTTADRLKRMGLKPFYIKGAWVWAINYKNAKL